jgi:hypothetical protein
VANLTSEPALPVDDLSIDDDAAADSDLSTEEDHVLLTNGSTATRLGQYTGISIVGDGDWDRKCACIPKQVSKRYLVPTQVWSDDHRVCCTVNEPDNGNSYTKQWSVLRSRADLGDKLCYVSDRFFDGRAVPWVIDAYPMQYRPAESDDGDGKIINGNLNGKNRVLSGVGTHGWRWPTGTSIWRTRVFEDESRFLKLTDESGHRASS